MLPSLLFSAFATFAAAATLPFSESPNLTPRSPDTPKNLFSRQSTFSCNNGYFCNDGQTCCGTECCNTGYTCSSVFSCDPDSSVSTCTASQTICGTTCCDADQTCDASSSTCSSGHKPSSGSGSGDDTDDDVDSSDKLPGRALGWIAAAVVAAVALVGGAVLWIWRTCLGCFGRGKRAKKGAKPYPLAYGMVGSKDTEPLVHEVAPGAM